MKAVIDTNVFVSWLFYSGTPRTIYLSWTRGEFVGVLSFEILAEYRRVATAFIKTERDVQVEEAIQLVVSNSLLIEAHALDRSICRDPDDDKLISCALHGGADYIVSGDKDLLALQGESPTPVLSPSGFLARLRSGT